MRFWSVILALAVVAGAASANATCGTPTCGDNIVEVGEGCDDGNTVDGDGCSANCVTEFDLDQCYIHSDWTDHRDSSEQGWWFRNSGDQQNVLGTQTNRHVWTDSTPYNWPTFFRYNSSIAQMSGVITNPSASNDDHFCVNVVMNILSQAEVENRGCNGGAGQFCDPAAGYTYFEINEDESIIKVCDGDKNIGSVCEIGYDDAGGSKPGRWGFGGNVLENNGDFGLSTWLYIAGKKADINIDLDPCPQFPEGECPPGGFDPRACTDEYLVQDYPTASGGFVTPNYPAHPIHNLAIVPSESTFSACEVDNSVSFSMKSEQNGDGTECTVEMTCNDVGIKSVTLGDTLYANQCSGSLVCTDGFSSSIVGKKRGGANNYEFYCEPRMLNGNPITWCGTWYNFWLDNGSKKYGDIEWTPSCPVCGDGILSPTEACDYVEGSIPGCRDASFGDDACTFCGDEEVQFGLETCEPITHPECDSTCNNRPQFPGCVTPFTDASICGYDFKLKDYTAAGGLQVRNSYWPGEWTVLNFADDLASDFDWCAPDNSDGDFEFSMSGEVRHNDGTVCEFEYECLEGEIWAGVGYGLSNCTGTLFCPGIESPNPTPVLTLHPKSNAEGYEATIHTKWGVTSISAWVCYPSKNHAGEYSDLDGWAACGDIIATPECPPS